ncbi:hypothetical protein Tco_0193850 [Tanacetum coccineum]
METQKPLLKDEDGEEVDVYLYRSMIGSLMYLTSSRPDIMFAVCACARYQVNPKVSHLHAVKRIFRYLKGQPKLGLWYPKDSPFDLVAYTDSDYAGASLDRKSITRGCQFLRCRLILWQCKKQTVVANSTTEAEYVAASSCCGQNGIGVNVVDSKLMLLRINLLLLGKVNAARHNLLLPVAKTVNGEVQLQALVDGKKIIITKATSSVPKENLADEAVYEERDDSLERATTTTTGLDAEQDRGVNTPRSGEDSLQLKELMEFCTKLQQRVIDLENTKTAQAQKITSLKKRVKKLERKKKARTRGLKRLYKVGLSARIDSSDDEASLGDQKDASKQGRKIHDIDANEDITLKNVHDADMFGVHDLEGDEVFVETEEPVVNAATTTKLKSTKPKAVTTAAITTITAVIRPKAKGLVIQEQEQASTPITSSKAETTQESSSKRAGEALEQESSKKQKVDDDKETEELKQCMEIISDDGDDVTIEATPLSTKSPTIVDYKIYKEGKVHCVTMQNILYYLLVEKMYPFTKHTLHQMFNDVKLQVDYECEMAFELLKLVKKQLKEGYVPQ